MAEEICRSCDEPIKDDAWRWRCTVCRIYVVHYAHVEGGVPVASTPKCPDCGADLRGQEGRPKPSDDQESLFR